MRMIDDHKIRPDEAITIATIDEPGEGGANHHYTIEGFNTTGNKSDPFVERYGKPSNHTTIVFQNGPIAEHGVNGITHEALMAIIIDRLRSFQNGPYRCRENALAITHLEESLHWLQQRTLARMRRGVEGTSAV